MGKVITVFLCGFFLIFSITFLNIGESSKVKLSGIDKSLEDFARDLISRNALERKLLEQIRINSNIAKVSRVVPRCKTVGPCVIRKNNGGILEEFQAAAKAVLETNGLALIIDGDCMSACAVLADMARPKVCITEHAMFWFHKGYNRNFKPGKPLFRFDPPHAQDIRSWVKYMGGFPTDDAHMLKMHVTEAKWHWPMCKLQTVPLPRPNPLKGLTAIAG